jgi:hypothetical protein
MEGEYIPTQPEDHQNPSHNSKQPNPFHLSLFLRFCIS